MPPVRTCSLFAIAVFSHWPFFLLCFEMQTFMQIHVKVYEQSAVLRAVSPHSSVTTRPRCRTIDWLKDGNYSRLSITQTFRGNRKRLDLELSRVKLYRKWPEGK